MIFSNSETSIVYNAKDGKSMVFIQTAEMLELYKRNSEGGVLLHSGEQKQFPSKYGMKYLLLNGVDQVCGNILTFAIGLYSEGSQKMAYKWFLEKCSVLHKPIKTIVVELNPKLIKSVEK
jgi:hypothetical protein